MQLSHKLQSHSLQNKLAGFFSSGSQSLQYKGSGGGSKLVLFVFVSSSSTNSSGISSNSISFSVIKFSDISAELVCKECQIFSISVRADSAARPGLRHVICEGYR